MIRIALSQNPRAGKPSRGQIGRANELSLAMAGKR